MNTLVYKQQVLLFITFLILSFNGYSQAVEITPGYGYQFGTRLNYGPNYIKAKGSSQFGITLGYELYENYMAEISYTHQGSELRIRDVFYSPAEERLSDYSLDWIQVGATRSVGYGNVRPFGGAAVGLAILTPDNVNTDITSDIDSSTNFAFSFKGGVNIMFTESVGLNLQGNLYVPVQWGGVFIAGGPGGISSGVSVTSTTLIFGISGGLVFRLGT